MLSLWRIMGTHIHKCCQRSVRHLYIKDPMLSHKLHTLCVFMCQLSKEKNLSMHFWRLPHQLLRHLPGVKGIPETIILWCLQQGKLRSRLLIIIRTRSPWWQTAKPEPDRLLEIPKYCQICPRKREPVKSRRLTAVATSYVTLRISCPTPHSARLFIETNRLNLKFTQKKY